MNLANFKSSSIIFLLTVINLTLFSPFLLAQEDNGSLDSIQTIDAGSDVNMDSGEFNQEDDPNSAGLDFVIETLSLDDQDLATALNRIADESNINILGLDKAKGRVRVFLSKVETLDALRIVLESNQLAFQSVSSYAQNSNDKQSIIILTPEEFEAQNGFVFNQKIQSRIFNLTTLKVSDVKKAIDEMKSNVGKIFSDEDKNMIVALDAPERIKLMDDYIKERDQPISTEIFKLQFIQGKDILKTIEDMVTKGLGRAQLDERANSIVVTDTKEKIKRIETLVKELNQNKKTVLLEAKIIQIALNEEHLQGIDWEAIVSEYQNTKIKSDRIEGALETGKTLSLGTVSSDDLNVLLDALDTVGIPNVISNSKMTIELNESFDVVVRNQDVVALSQVQNDSLDDADEDMSLSIVSWVDFENNFTFKIKPKLVFDQRNAGAFNVRVKDGATIVVGGLLKQIKIESTQKIPLLGDLPFVGFAFRKQGKRLIKSETVVFLTPKTVKTEESLLLSDPKEDKAQ